MRINRKNQKGQSLLELLVAMAVFVLVVSGIMFLTMDAHVANRQGAERSKATLLAQEGMEAAVSIRNRSWKDLADGKYGLSYQGKNFWEFTKSPDVIDKYTRLVTISPVHRDLSGNVVTSGGKADPSTKKITSLVTWDFQPDRKSEVVLESYITNWKSVQWIQTTQAQFNDPAATKTNVVVTNNQDGEILLAQGEGSYGNQFRVDSTAGILDMTDRTYRISMRFTAQHTMDVTGFLLYLQAVVGNNQPTYRYGLQADNNGNPSGVWLGARNQGYVDYQATAGATGWTQIYGLNDAVTLTVGMTYHLVVQWQSTNPGNNKYISLRASQPLNKLIPYDQTADPNSSVLTSRNNGSTWTVSADTQPIYVLRSSNGQFEGNPYHTYTNTSLNSTNWSGENFTLSSDQTVSKVNFMARRAPSGPLPNADLAVSLVNVNTGVVLGSGTVNGLTISYANYTIVFSSPINLSSGVTYRLIFSTAATNSFYQVRRLDTFSSQAYAGITYQGTTSIYASTTNGGSTWTANSNYDLGGYYFTTLTGYVSSGDYISTPFDTGSANVAHNFLAWTATLPSGTTLRFQIRQAAAQPSLSSAQWVGPDGTSSTYFNSPGQIIFGTTGLRWIQYRAYLTSTGADTPVLSDVTWDYEP